MWNNIKNNQRHIWAILVLLAVFALNRSFPAEVITAGDCLGGNCKIESAVPSLSDENPIYYVDEIFKTKSAKREYYRLIFDISSDKDSEIEILASDFLENEASLKKIKLNKNIKEDFSESFFSVQGNYTNLTFKKINKNDGAKIFINNARVAKLDIRTDAEFAKLIPTKKNGASLYDLIQSQDKNNDIFSQLCEEEIIFGQIFKATESYITATALDMDIIKQGTGAGRKYKLDLREVKYNDSETEIKSDILANVDFDLQSIEKYRREDGKFQFPIFSRLEKDRHYFIGLNNDKATADKLNCLKLKGSYKDNAYSEGLTVVKTQGETYTTQGDLYFELYGPRLEEYKGKKFLFGSTIEGIGKNAGLFKYQIRDNVSNIIDLDSYSSDINISDDNLTIYGSTVAPESNFIYKFETIYPFRKFTVSGEPSATNWNEINILYSYDKKDWAEMPLIGVEDDETQRFNYSVAEKYSKDLVYIKIVPKNNADGTKKSKYGIKNFKFEAELFIK